VDRELLLAVLVPLLCGPSIFLMAGVARLLKEEGDRPEPDLWRRVRLPILPAILFLSALLGWALMEPDDAEAMRGVPIALAAVIAIAWTRTVVRGVLALVPRRSAPLAATVGLLRPRIVLDACLGRELDAAALHAVELHERAHAGHRDPLRIWIAQLITDLQCPIPGAQARLEIWLASLERARDDEAVRNGADPVALAHALVTCAKLARHDSHVAAAHFVGSGACLKQRVRRLLEGRARELPKDPQRPMVGIGVGALVAGVVGGVCGEKLVGWITAAFS